MKPVHKCLDCLNTHACSPDEFYGFRFHKRRVTLATIVNLKSQYKNTLDFAAVESCELVPIPFKTLSL